MKKYCIRIAGVLAAAALLSQTALPAHATSGNTIEENIAYNQSLAVQTNELVNWPIGPTVSAESAILIEAESGAILYAKNIHLREYPASTTKLLTTLIATEECSLDELVTFSHAAVFDTPRDSNNIAIDENEQLTVEECLQAILVRSANECAFALAEHITGTTWQDFAPRMNARAEELGCMDSSFVNPNGLPDDDHYTSAYDLAQIGRAFFANELLCKYSLMPSIHFYPTERQKDEIIEYNATQILPGKQYAYDGLVGVKTGFTSAARQCLVSCAERNGMKLICVVLKDEAPYQYTDTIALFDYGFSNFAVVNVSKSETKYSIGATGSFYSDIDVFGSSEPILSLNQEDEIVLPLTTTFDSLESSISYETGDDRQVALITYRYQGWYLGCASVDFSANRSLYDFDSEPEESAAAAPGAGERTGVQPNDDNVVFINVVRVGMTMLAAASTVLLLYGLLRFWRYYRTHHHNWRREYRKSRRVSHKKRKRPNRFRDYDF